MNDDPATQSEITRAVRVGLGFGIPIMLPAIAYGFASGDYDLTGAHIVAALICTEVLGAVAAYRTPPPSRVRAVAGAVTLAFVGVVLLLQQSPSVGTLNALLLAGIVLAPVGAWLLAGWKAGLMSFGLMLMWMLVAYS